MNTPQQNLTALADDVVRVPDEPFLTIRGRHYPLRGIMADASRNERLFWQQWVRPPFCWNRIKTHQQVTQSILPMKPPEQQVATPTKTN